jgi:DnaJ family protein C protein 9
VGAVQTFLSGYKGGDEEREAVLESYRKGKGDMDVVYECVMGSGVLEDDDRFRKIIDEGIEKGEVEAYKKYTEESEQSKARRRKTAEAEAKEAEVEAEKMKRKGKKAEGGKKSAGGGGESELMAMIQKRQQERGGTFLEGMEAKYKRIEEEEKAKKAGKKGGKKRKQEEVDADEPLEEAFAKMGERMQKGKKNKR